MGKINYEGVIAAMTTPFFADGENIQKDTIEEMTKFVADNGVIGIIPGGTTGEFGAMTVEERIEVNRLYCEAGKKHGLSVIAGVGSLSTKEAALLAREAADAGADGLMVVAPFYTPPSFEELVRHLNEISRAADLPILYYHLPDTTGLQLTAEELVELGARTNVDSVKFTEGDMVKFNTIIQMDQQDIVPLCGFDGLNLSALAAGAPGSVWGMAAFLPDLAVKFFNALAVDKDLDTARDLWRYLLPICDALESGNYAAGVKAGLKIRDIDAGPIRLPASAIDDEATALLKDLIDRALDAADGKA